MVYRNNDRIELFDCLSPKKKIVKLLRRYGVRIQSNIYPMMPEKSTLCGEYCLYFAINRFFNPQLDMHEVLKEFFSVNKFKNDKKVNNFRLYIDNL